jgi:hypothetical protein
LRGERTSSDCDGQDDLFHSDYQWLTPDLLFFQSLATQAQRRRPPGAPIATATARRRSLQLLVRPLFG